MSTFPTALDRPQPDELVITWSDGRKRRYSARELRKVCPCATCREEREVAEARTAQAPEAGNLATLPVIAIEETRPPTIEGMRPVGNYAYAIAFSDGHNTGIFTLEFLRELGEEV